MKSQILIRAACVLLVLFSTQCSRRKTGDELMASKWSDKFHHPGCEWAAEIKDKNLRTFGSAEEAIDAGFRPCSQCRNRIKGLPASQRDGSSGESEPGADADEPIRKFESLN